MRSSGLAAAGLLIFSLPGAAQVALGPELQVNPAHGTYEDVPSTAIGDDGRGVVVWNEFAGRNKHARFLDAGGSPIGDPVRLNKSLNQGFPETQDVDMTRTGNGLACWGTGGRSQCRTLTSSGQIGPHEVSASSRPTVFGEREYSPRVAHFPDGRSIVAWFYAVEDISTGVDTYSIEARLFADNGLPEGDVLEVADLEAWDVTNLAVASISEDRALVVWNDSGVDASGQGIRGQILSTGGNRVGSPFVVNTFTIGDQRLPDIDADLSGRSVVVWESIGQDGSATGIYGQRLDRDGGRIGEEFQVSSSFPSDQTWPAVAVDSFGNFVVVFESFQESNELVEDVFLRAYRADGTPRAEQVRANDVIVEEQSYPSAAISDTGLVQVAYQSWRSPGGDPFSYNYDILTRRFVLPCETDATTLCLQGGRFQVRALWRDYSSRRGTGQAIPLTDDSGGFWFFGPGNLEILVKLVNACGTNDRFWIYAGGLTDVEVDLLVTDTWSGEVELFENGLGGAYQPVQRIDLFPVCGAEPLPKEGFAPLALPADGSLQRPPSLSEAGAPGAACEPNATTLCLADGRFRVRSQWHDFSDHSGIGKTGPTSDPSGLFWFFAPENLEVGVKVIDGCAFNGRYWIYSAGLTNVAVDLTVEDTLRHATWSRSTNLGEPYPAFLDSAAFATCP